MTHLYYAADLAKVQELCAISKKFTGNLHAIHLLRQYPHAMILRISDYQIAIGQQTNAMRAFQ